MIADIDAIPTPPSAHVHVHAVNNRTPRSRTKNPNAKLVLSDDYAQVVYVRGKKRPVTDYRDYIPPVSKNSTLFAYIKCQGENCTRYRQSNPAKHGGKNLCWDCCKSGIKKIVNLKSNTAELLQVQCQSCRQAKQSKIRSINKQLQDKQLQLQQQIEMEHNQQRGHSITVTLQNNNQNMEMMNSNIATATGHGNSNLDSINIIPTTGTLSTSIYNSTYTNTNSNINIINAHSFTSMNTTNELTTVTAIQLQFESNSNANTLNITPSHAHDPLQQLSFGVTDHENIDQSQLYDYNDEHDHDNQNEFLSHLDSNSNEGPGHDSNREALESDEHYDISQYNICLDEQLTTAKLDDDRMLPIWLQMNQQATAYQELLVLLGSHEYLSQTTTSSESTMMSITPSRAHPSHSNHIRNIIKHRPGIVVYPPSIESTSNNIHTGYMSSDFDSSAAASTLMINDTITPVPVHVNGSTSVQTSNSIRPCPRETDSDHAYELTSISDSTDDPESAKLYEVETILRHKGSVKTRNIEFLVKWKGFPRNESTWEPPTSFKSHEILDEYFRSRAQSTRSSKLWAKNWNLFRLGVNETNSTTGTSDVESQSDSDHDIDMTVESEDEDDSDYDAYNDNGDSNSMNIDNSVQVESNIASGSGSGPGVEHVTADHASDTITSSMSTSARVADSEPMGVVRCVSIPNQHPHRFIHSDCMVIIKALHSDWKTAKSKNKSKHSKKQSHHDHDTIANSEHHTNSSYSTSSTTEHYDANEHSVENNFDLNEETLHPTLFHTVRGINYKFKE